MCGSEMFQEFFSILDTSVHELDSTHPSGGKLNWARAKQIQQLDSRLKFDLVLVRFGLQLEP